MTVLTVSCILYLRFSSCHLTVSLMAVFPGLETTRTRRETLGGPDSRDSWGRWIVDSFRLTVDSLQLTVGNCCLKLTLDSGQLAVNSWLLTVGC